MRLIIFVSVTLQNNFKGFKIKYANFPLFFQIANENIFVYQQFGISKSNEPHLKEKCWSESFKYRFVYAFSTVCTNYYRQTTEQFHKSEHSYALCWFRIFTAVTVNIELLLNSMCIKVKVLWWNICFPFKIFRIMWWLLFCH